MTLYAYNSDFYKKSYVWNLFFILLVLIMIWRIGFQPLGLETGTDRANYANNFFSLKEFGETSIERGDKDKFFNYIAKFFPSEDVELYMIFLGILYVGIYAFSCYRLKKEYSLWLFVSFILSFGFLGYGINTMRAGIAFAFVILGIASYKNFLLSLVFYICAINIHFSTIIPICMLILSYFIKFNKSLLLLWGICIIISMIAGDYFNSMFISMFEEEESRTYYLMGTGEKYNVGFRIDFILYSFIPIIIGWYYIYRRGFNSNIYKMIYNAYILTNSFWLLVIRADFSDRFAYLSWFLIPLVLVYPILRELPIVNKTNKWVGTILLGETVFLAWGALRSGISSFL